jgi:oligopeptidase B
MAAAPPVAKKVPFKHSYHGRDFEDSYNWLRDDDKKEKRKEIMEHLEAEQAFAKAKLSEYDKLKQELYDEMLGRIQVRWILALLENLDVDLETGGR